MPAALDITGQRFSYLVAIQCVGSDKHGKRVWRFICDCGKTHEANASDVVKGATQSCGHIKADVARTNAKIGAGKIRAQKTKHGCSGSKVPEYNIWCSMRQRCNNPNNQDYAEWGARGISVCERWNDFANFITDMGYRPSVKHSIDRIDNAKNYEPSNCRWASNTEQANNRRPRRYLRKPTQTQDAE